MILTLLGLFLSFIGAVILVVDTCINLGKPKTSFIPSKYNKNGKPIKYMRQEIVYGENGEWPTYKEVKISKEEKLQIVFLSFLSIGFLFQILDFFLIL